MLKKSLFIILTLILIVSAVLPAFAETLTEPQTYQITVTNDGGKFDFGYVEMNFKKNFLGKDSEPITFNVSFYAENGVPYIDISPSISEFSKDVLIKVKKGTMSFYDTVTGETIDLQLDNYIIKVEHFSRYIIID